MEEIIFHITEKSFFEEQKNNSTYVSPSFPEEGFIHLSTENQVNKTLQNYYLGVQNLLLLHINTFEIKDLLKYELASNGEYFPHCYGLIPRNAIQKIEKLNTPQLGIPTWNK